MRQFVKFLKKKVDSHNGDLVAIRQMYAFQCAMSMGQLINSLISEIVDAHKTDASQFWKIG